MYVRYENYNNITEVYEICDLSVENITKILKYNWV